MRPEFAARLKHALADLAEVLELRRLTEGERAQIIRLEEAAEEGGAAGGLVEFVNEGIRGALSCDVVYAALTGPMLDDPPHPWTVMLDSENNLIGEWLPQHRRREVRDSGNAMFLSPDFVLYKDRRPVGKSRFVMPYVCVPLEGLDEGLCTCGIGTPSGPADAYIRALMGNPGKDKATLLVGVTPVRCDPLPTQVREGESDE